MKSKNDLMAEISSFRELWAGGYLEGDPLDPLGASGYGPYGYLSVLHVVYLVCIKPYIHSDTVALEIGPGRGGWTRALLPAREVWCLDALSAEHNGFWDYVGRQEHVHYNQVSDFSCRDIPDDHFDFLFSFGCLCHVSFDGIQEYMTNLRAKMRPGAEAFVMVADYDKYNNALRAAPDYHVLRTLQRGRGSAALSKAMLSAWQRFGRKSQLGVEKSLQEDADPSPGRWYHAGTGRTCEMLESLGYTVINPDLGLLARDPIIHFRRGV